MNIRETGLNPEEVQLPDADDPVSRVRRMLANALNGIVPKLAEKLAPKPQTIIFTEVAPPSEITEIEITDIKPKADVSSPESLLKLYTENSLDPNNIPTPLLNNEPILLDDARQKILVGESDSKFPVVVVREEMMTAIQDWFRKFPNSEAGGFLIGIIHESGIKTVEGFLPVILGTTGATSVNFSSDDIALCYRGLDIINENPEIPHNNLQIIGTIHSHPEQWTTSPVWSGMNGDLHMLRANPNLMMIMQVGGQRDGELGIWNHSTNANGEEIAQRQTGMYLVPSPGGDKLKSNIRMFTEHDTVPYFNDTLEEIAIDDTNL